MGICADNHLIYGRNRADISGTNTKNDILIFEEIMCMNQLLHTHSPEGLDAAKFERMQLTLWMFLGQFSLDVSG